MSFRLPGELALSRQWIETVNKRPKHEGWTNPENWKLYTGIKGDRGFVLGDRFVVLDFDHVLNENGEWVNEEAHRFYTELIRQFPTWVEFSSSGRGLHVWYLGECFKFSIQRMDYDEENRIGVDVCESNRRQVVVTGEVLVNNRIASVDDALREFIRSQPQFDNSCTSARGTNVQQSTWVNTRSKDRGRRALEGIDCSSLDYDDWFKVTSSCKQLGLFREWEEWCQTNPEKYNARENMCIWNHCKPRAENPVKCLRLFLRPQLIQDN